MSFDSYGVFFHVIDMICLRDLINEAFFSDRTRIGNGKEYYMNHNGSLDRSWHESSIFSINRSSLSNVEVLNGGLVVKSCNISSWPFEKLREVSSISIHGSIVPPLPDTIQWVGNISIGGSSITSLPEGLKEIGGDIDIYHPLTFDLPENFTVGGNVYLRRRNNIAP